jgi:ArsR family transcriptional regulator
MTTSSAAHDPSTLDRDPPSVCCGGATTWVEADVAEELARQLGALADPVRLQVLSIIANSTDGEICACDFVAPIGKSQPTISHHLKVLTEAGLVTGDKRGRWVWYRLAPGALDDLLGSLADVTSPAELGGAPVAGR